MAASTSAGYSHHISTLTTGDSISQLFSDLLKVCTGGCELKCDDKHVCVPCPLCPPAVVKPNRKTKVLDHLTSTHLKSSISVGVFTALMCKRQMSGQHISQSLPLSMWVYLQGQALPSVIVVKHAQKCCSVSLLFPFHSIHHPSHI